MVNPAPLNKVNPLSAAGSVSIPLLALMGVCMVGGGYKMSKGNKPPEEQHLPVNEEVDQQEIVIEQDHENNDVHIEQRIIFEEGQLHEEVHEEHLHLPHNPMTR